MTAQPTLPDGYQRDFQGVWIPAHIWLDTRISWMQKCILTEIRSLQDPKRGCFASNTYLGKIFNTSPGAMAKHLNFLRELDYIETVSFDGRTRSMKVVGFDPTSKLQGLPKGVGRVYQKDIAKTPPYVQESTSRGTDPAGNKGREINPVVFDILRAYPRKNAKQAGCRAITKALITHPAEEVLNKTKLFAAAWAGAKPEDMQYCPMASTWFNQERFLEDPATWVRNAPKNGTIGQLRLKKDALEKRIEQLANETVYDMSPNHKAKVTELKECRAKLEEVQRAIINS